MFRWVFVNILTFYGNCLLKIDMTKGGKCNRKLLIWWSCTTLTWPQVCATQWKTTRLCFPTLSSHPAHWFHDIQFDSEDFFFLCILFLVWLNPVQGHNKTLMDELVSTIFYSRFPPHFSLWRWAGFFSVCVYIQQLLSVQPSIVRDWIRPFVTSPPCFYLTNQSFSPHFALVKDRFCFLCEHMTSAFIFMQPWWFRHPWHLEPPPLFTTVHCTIRL